jgi:site-specific DNA recombinase
VTRYNPADCVIVYDVPDLRIVSDEICQSAKQRQLATRTAVHDGDRGVRSERARRPAYLLSGLLRCGLCRGGFSKRSDTHYACSTAHNTGTCTNRLRIRRDVLEASVLSGLKTQLMRADLVREFIAEYHRELSRLSATVDLDRSRRKDDLARIDREIHALIEAIKSGIRSPAIQTEL